MAKFCTHCGKEISEEATICTECGCMVKNADVKDAVSSTTEASGSPKVSLILGIVGIVFAWLFAIVGHIVSIIGIAFGIKEYKKTNKISGLVLCIIAEVCSIVSSIIGATAMSGLF